MARLRHGLRILLALVTLGCATAPAAAEALVTDASALCAQRAWILAGTQRQPRRASARRQLHLWPRALVTPTGRAHAAAQRSCLEPKPPALSRAPRLYLRHGVSLR
jgi:hypothetical protein